MRRPRMRRSPRRATSFASRSESSRPTTSSPISRPHSCARPRTHDRRRAAPPPRRELQRGRAQRRLVADGRELRARGDDGVRRDSGRAVRGTRRDRRGIRRATAGRRARPARGGNGGRRRGRARPLRVGDRSGSRRGRTRARARRRPDSPPRRALRPVTAVEPIDLRHLGAEHVIASYVVETDDGRALFDCGPSTTIDALKAGLAARGLALGDIRHLLLSHIHFDHAGAAGALVREHPALQVHVSGIGAPHLVDPSRLERSARRLYGDTFDTLWGELAPVPQANVHVVGDEVLGLACFPSPGHASHHVSYLDRDGTLYCGDAAGVRIQPGRYVLPPTPPPEFDLEVWQRTVDAIERRGPDRLALIHFGVADDPGRHLAELRLELYDWAEFVRGGATEEEFVEYVRAELANAGENLAFYDVAMPLWQSYRGLKRWADKQA